MFFVWWRNEEGDQVFEALVLRGSSREHCLYSVRRDDKAIIMSLIEEE